MYIGYKHKYRILIARANRRFSSVNMSQRSRQPRLAFENIVIFFSIILMIALGLTFYSAIEERTEEYVNYHKNISTKATLNVGYEISNRINNRRILVKNFIEDNQQLINQLIGDTENTELYEALDKKISKYFIDYVSFSIADKNAELMVGHFEHEIGFACRADTKNFVSKGQQTIRVHPNPAAYHFDVLTRFNTNNTDYIFFVSFDTDEITNLLRVSKPEDHNLLIRFKNKEDLIEITNNGGRNDILNRVDFRMTASEKERVLATYEIPGTVWDVADIHREGLFKEYKKAAIHDSITTYLFFVVMTIVMTIVIIIEIRRKTRIEHSLLLKNNEIETLNTNLAKLSITDSLTGLYNRRYMDTQSRKEWNRAKRTNTTLYASLIDIDKFKQYNDNHGHAAGDQCLKVVGKLLLSFFKRSNEFVARYGGEEFIVFSACSQNDEFVKRINDIAINISETDIHTANSKELLHVTVSAGIASSSDSGIDSLSKLLKAADSALYKAKDTGRNRVIRHV